MGRVSANLFFWTQFRAAAGPKHPATTPGQNREREYKLVAAKLTHCKISRA